MNRIAAPFADLICTCSLVLKGIFFSLWGSKINIGMPVHAGFHSTLKAWVRKVDGKKQPQRGLPSTAKVTKHLLHLLYLD